MRVAFFHDGDPRLPTLRRELSERGHLVLAVGPGMSHAVVASLLENDRPDVIHSLGRGFVAVLSAAYWHRRLRALGTKRVHDVRGVVLFANDDNVVDGSLMGKELEAAYQRVLGLR